MGFFKGSQAGDTIVEVIISAGVISLALITSYSLSGRSLHDGVAANQRAEALALAQSQIDLLNYQYSNDGNFSTDYETTLPYCINADATKNTTVGTDKLCDNYGGSVYNIGIGYSTNSQTFQVFIITATWNDSTSSTGQDNIKLYYKVPGTE